MSYKSEKWYCVTLTPDTYRNIVNDVGPLGEKCDNGLILTSVDVWLEDVERSFWDIVFRRPGRRIYRVECEYKTEDELKQERANVA